MRERCELHAEIMKIMFINNVNSSATTHKRNLQLLMIEIHQIKNNLNPPFMQGIFAEKDNYYNLRNVNHLHRAKVRTTKYGTENIQYRG